MSFQSRVFLPSRITVVIEGTPSKGAVNVPDVHREGFEHISAAAKLWRQEHPQSPMISVPSGCSAYAINEIAYWLDQAVPANSLDVSYNGLQDFFKLLELYTTLLHLGVDGNLKTQVEGAIKKVFGCRKLEPYEFVEVEKFMSQSYPLGQQDTSDELNLLFIHTYAYHWHYTSSVDQETMRQLFATLCPTFLAKIEDAVRLNEARYPLRNEVAFQTNGVLETMYEDMTQEVRERYGNRYNLRRR